MKHTFPLSAVALAAVLALSGCGGEKAAEKAGGSTAQASVLTRNNVTEPQSLDPHQITGVPEINVVRDLFEGLVETDAQGKIVPAVAGTWASKDNRVWVFKLRQDAK